MGWQETPFTFPLLLGAAALVGLAVYLFWRRRGPVAGMGAALLLAGALWMAADALELASTTRLAKLLWNIPSTLSIGVICSGWLVLVLLLTGWRSWLTRRNLVLLAVMPLLTVGIVASNDLHGLYWSHLALDTSGPLITLEKTHGVWFWAFLLYLYILLLAACLLLIAAMRRARRPHRWQAAFLLVAALAAIVVNLLELAGLTPFPDLITLPIYAIACLLATWSFLRTRRADVVAVSQEAVLRSMGDAVFVTDAHQLLLDLNAAAERLIGRPAAQVIGQPLPEVLPSWAGQVETLQQLAEAGTEVVLPVESAQRTYEARASAVVDWRGQLISWAVVLHDITAYKEIEAALRQRSAELQARNEELAAFARTVAHDLKGPLVGVIGYAETTQRFYHLLPQEQVEEYLGTIVRSGRQLDRIIDELLLLSSVRADRVQRDRLDMGSIVAQVQKRLDDMIQEYQTEISLPGTWPAALGHATWVREVWCSYLSNAMKYGGRPPRIELGAVEEAGGMVRFWARDNGHGLTPEEQARLFQPSPQMSRVRAEGHGLGLSIVRHVVERLGGQVGVESEVGQGSAFYFTLPAAPGADG